MNEHPVQIVYESLTHILSPYMDETKPVTGKCSCCHRPAEQFGSQGYVFKNSYNMMVTHCTPCQTYFTSAPELMGVENPKRPDTGQKFGMWSGVGAIIDVAKRKAILFAPPGVVVKLPPAFFEQVEVVTATSGQHLQYLFENDIAFPAIYIQNFGRKTSELIRSLRVSHSEDVIYACADDLMTPQNAVSFVIDLKKARDLHEKLQAYDKKKTDIFFRTVTLLAYSSTTPDKAFEEFKKHDLLPLVRALPADPHQRLNLVRLLRKV